MSVPGKLDLQNRAVGSSFPATLHVAARLLRALQRPLSYWVLSVVSRAPALPLSDLILHCPLLCSRISRHTDPPFPHTGQAHCPEHSSLLHLLRCQVCLTYPINAPALYSPFLPCVFKILIFSQTIYYALCWLNYFVCPFSSYQNIFPESSHFFLSSLLYRQDLEQYLTYSEWLEKICWMNEQIVGIFEVVVF